MAASDPPPMGELFPATRSALKAPIHEVLDERMSDGELVAALAGGSKLTAAEYAAHRARVAEIASARQAEFRAAT